MNNEGLSTEQISRVTKKSESEVRQVIENHKDK
jgi:hypothetical protein